MAGQIHIGIGGWTFEPWRGVFYPAGLPQAKELEYASRQLTSIEINGTYYGSQSPETFAKWRDATPEGFVFSVKGSRFCTNRKVLAEGKESVDRFVESVLPLEDRLGPLLWQLAPTKKYDHHDIAGFLDNLPDKAGGRALRHVIEARHDSFRSPEFLAQLRERNVGLVYAEHFTYPEDQLDAWAGRLKTWAAGGLPDELPLVDAGHAPARTPRDVFAYVIHEGKVRAPAAAKALIAKST